MISVAVFRIGKVVKLHKASPKSCKKLIPPDLIGSIDESSSNGVQKFIKNSFFLLNQVPINDFSSNKDNQEPNCVNNVDNDDWVEVPQEVDVCPEKVKPDWTILNNIPHPLMLNLLTVRRNEVV